MADENFEDDLFADLYDDNDASKTGPGPAPPAPTADDTAAPAAKDEPSHAPADQGADQQMSHTQDDEEEEDDEDDVDFNLGGGSTGGAMANAGGDMNTHQGSGSGYDDRAQTPPYGSVHRASAKDEGKMFIGGLNWETTDQSLRDYFSQFGEVVECTVMRDSNSGRSRGFGFLTFKDAKTVNVVMVKEHFLDGKIIDPKRAIPRDEQEKTSKIFVGGVSQDTTDQEFRDYFAQFGRVVDATLMMDKDTGRPRGFGFVTFESEAGVDACINIPLEIHGKPVEVKRAQPRGNLREEEEAQRRNRFKKDEQGAQGAQSGMGQQMGGSGMSPQVMAQYFQRMQQYFAMMQGQMAMNRGMQMNPQMMQQMQMQQMQQMQQMMGRGGQGQGGQNMMNPQMMQQMQQQMMQQQQQAGGGGGQGGFDGGNGGFEGNYDQSFQQQQPPTGPQGGSHGGGHGRRGRGGYGGGRGGYNNNNMGGGGQGGAPTSWEGMYDDVPQPNAGDGPSKAPVGAPTGPKRMNQPGANYRGGGRGGHRGFHPYGR